jgi:hypothetical protein
MMATNMMMMDMMMMSTMMIMSTIPRQWAGPGYTYSGSVRSGQVDRPVQTKVTVILPENYEVEKVMIVYDKKTQTYRVATPDDPSPCAAEEHQLKQLPSLIEITFIRGEDKRVIYAEQCCTRCGQHFFLTPTEFVPFPPPKTPPPQPQLPGPEGSQPNPNQPNPYGNQYPPQQYPNQQYPMGQDPNQQFNQGQYPNQQYPNQQYPMGQDPNQQFNQGYPQQYPNQQYPMGQDPNQQYNQGQYPNQYPNQYPQGGYPNQQYPNQPYMEPVKQPSPPVPAPTVIVTQSCCPPTRQNQP